MSYIVSAFNRPNALRCCLSSLQCQTDPDFEVIVADNGDEQMRIESRYIVSVINDTRFRSVSTALIKAIEISDCYHAAEWVANNEAKGEWLCFPSDDSYYVPVFQEALLGKARREDLQLVYCNMLYDRRMGGIYRVLDVSPWPCSIDKTGFMIRRDVWIGFPNKPSAPGASCCDGEMIQEVVARGARHGKLEEILVVHN